MGFVIKDEKKMTESNYPRPEAGTHIARCVQCIDVGTYEDTRWEDSYPKRELYYGFEFPAMDAGPEGPVMMWKRYTHSMNEKATLRKELKKWRGVDYTEQQLAEGVDVSAVVGQPCQVSVEEWSNATTGKSGVQISGLAKPMAGIECPPQVCTSLVWSVDDWNEEQFNALPAFIKDRILVSDEAKARTAGDGADSADIPF